MKTTAALPAQGLVHDAAVPREESARFLRIDRRELGAAELKDVSGLGSVR